MQSLAFRKAEVALRDHRGLARPSHRRLKTHPLGRRPHGISLRLALRARLHEKPPKPPTGLVFNRRRGALFGS